MPGWTFEGDVLALADEASVEAVERALGGTCFWIGGRNDDIRAGNATLRDRIRPVCEAKRVQI